MEKPSLFTETLGRHDANFDELNHNFNRVNDALQGVMAELQAMRIAHSHRSSEREVNPFAGGSTSHDRSSGTFNVDRNHTTLKLNFPTYSGEGEDPTENPVAGEKGEDCVEEEEKGKPDIVEALSFCLYEINCLGFSVFGCLTRTSKRISSFNPAIKHPTRKFSGRSSTL